MQEVFEALHEAMARGEPVALATIVRATGSTPQRVGARVLVYEDGRTVGTIGGGCYENDAVQKARALLRDHGRPMLVRFDLNDDFAEETGLICGGQMEVFIEPVLPPPDLYVVGAGHVALHLAHIATATGFRVHVVDDREKFANRDRFPDAATVTVAPIADWLQSRTFSPSSFVVIVTRGHRHDLDALRVVVARAPRYAGLIGSRAKVARLRTLLESEGVAQEQLDRIHSPIGLDIGAVTPEEIAVSIVAELIAVRAGRLTLDSDSPQAVRPLRWTPPAPRALV